MQDKRQTLELARQAGIPCPQTFMSDERESLEDVAKKFRYPAVIKPRVSWYRTEAGAVSGRVSCARNGAEWVAQYQCAHLQIPRPLVQERLPGEGRGVALRIWNGALKTAL